MIRVDAAFDEAGLLRSCRVEGHGGAGPLGKDIVCAAVSVLVRTAFKTLSAREGIKVRGFAPKRGFFQMETDYTPGGKEFLAAAGAFLVEGLKSVSEDYPDCCKVNIHRGKLQFYEAF
jgi:uncharacterized protein YsxB (DUF464 family)